MIERYAGPDNSRIFYSVTSDPLILDERGNRTWQRFRPDQRFWAVGCSPAYLAHRIMGQWPGNDAFKAVCGSNICLHAEFWSEAWPFPSGGISFQEVEEIPLKYDLCLKCVEKDDTIE